MSAADVLIQAMADAVSRDSRIVDARYLTGEQIIDRTVTLPQNMHLLLGNAVFLTTITNGTPAWVLDDGAHLEGMDVATVLKTAASANISSMITNYRKTQSGQEYFYLSNLLVEALAAARVTTAVIEVQTIFINSYIRDVVVLCPNTLGLLIHGNSEYAGCGPIDINCCWFEGFGETNSRCVEVRGEPLGGYIQFQFRNCCFEHAGPGLDMVHIDGGPPGSSGVINMGLIESCYFETGYQGRPAYNSTGVRIKGGQQVSMIACSAGGDNSGTFVEIEWGRGPSGGTAWDNLLIGVNPGNGFQTTLRDHVADPSVVHTGFIPFYHQEYPPRIAAPATFQKLIVTQP